MLCASGCPHIIFNVGGEEMVICWILLAGLVHRSLLTAHPQRAGAENKVEGTLVATCHTHTLSHTHAHTYALDTILQETLAI